MVSSVAGDYRDVVCITPVVNITSGLLHKMFNQVLQVVHSVDLTVVATSMDNFSANRKFYAELWRQTAGKYSESTKRQTAALPALRRCLQLLEHLQYLPRKESLQLSSLLGSKIGKSSFKHIESVREYPSSLAMKIKD